MIALVSGATPTLRKYMHTGRYGRLIVPTSGDYPIDGLPWACDNSAYSGFDAGRFLRMLERLRPFPGCMWVTAPDVVAEAEATLCQFEEWEPIIRGDYERPLALVAQDGLTVDRVPWDRIACLFIGGTTEFKEGAAARELVRGAKRLGKLVHVGRCGTARRIRYFQALGADTFDGGVFSTHPEQAFTNFTSQLLHPQTGLEVDL